MSVNLCWSTPSFRRSQDNHWPGSRTSNLGASGFLLNRIDIFNAPVKRRRKCLVHAFIFRSLDKVGPVSIAHEEVFKIFMADPRQDSRIVYLVPVEMEDGQDSSVCDRINKIVRVP